MMEGTYFFGEHLRWNLGWHNPNPAGAFVAMWIPWLWGFAAMALRTGGRLRFIAAVALLLEAGLWFLLCKTYSRGALVAVVAAATLFILMEWLRGGRTHLWKAVFARLAMVAGLLVATGFFDRITPGYVVQDASAGNRLTLWRGGLQMIAVSPWTGWGVGQSGPAFMHWFQPLEANEAYLGMVNSYLHVGVERGLPILAVFLSIAGGIIISGLIAVMKTVGGRCGCPRAGIGDALMAAMCVLIVFLVANFFSTLWIYRNLWWGPAIASAWIIAVSAKVFGNRGLRVMALSFGIMIPISCCMAVVLVWFGMLGMRGPMISRSRDGTVSCAGGRQVRSAVVCFFADKATLGETWGKELRRLATARPDLLIQIPPKFVTGSFQQERRTFDWIVACGHRAPDGFAALAINPQARLVLVNPTGRELRSAKNVQILLPGLDTRREGVFWKSACKRAGWECVTIPGVGQDIRKIWPAVLDPVIAGDGSDLSFLRQP